MKWSWADVSTFVSCVTGREAVTFLVKLKQYIEDMPSMLL